MTDDLYFTQALKSSSPLSSSFNEDCGDSLEILKIDIDFDNGCAPHDASKQKPAPPLR
jgi:hypothetical protein